MMKGGGNFFELRVENHAVQRVLEHLASEQNVDMFTGIQQCKGQPELTMIDRAHSEAVSRVRQPIESLFNWIEQKTGIQCASKRRSPWQFNAHLSGDTFGLLRAGCALQALSSAYIATHLPPAG